MERSLILVARTLLALSLLTTSFVTPALRAVASGETMSEAVGEEDDLIRFDTIVRELDRQSSGLGGNSRGQLRTKKSDPFADIWIHGGVGVANTTQKIEIPALGGGTESVRLQQKGYQATLGIDLFSPSWAAEGVARSFGEEQEGDVRAALKEFELKLFYKSPFTRRAVFRIGGGLAARYLTLHRPDQVLEYTTPSSVITLGLDFYVNRAISIGADLSARNSLINETVDQTSYDGTIRMDTHF